jgi:hypothetical protein
MTARRAFIVLLALMAAPVLSQEAKKPKIEPTDFKDPGPVAYRFKKGQTESYTTTSDAKSVVGIQVGGQEMTITTKGTTRGRLTITPVDDAVPTKVELVTDKLQAKQTVETPMATIEVVIQDKKVKATSGGQVVFDSETGADNPMAAQFTQSTKILGKKVVATVDANGVVGPKLEGEADVAKQMQDVVGQGLFPVVWKGQSGLKPGDSWEVESELTVMQTMELKAPVKLKSAFKVLGAVLLDGVPCVDVEVRNTAKASDLEAVMTQGGVKSNVKILSLGIQMAGHAYYDPARNRVVYADTKGVVDFEAMGDVPGAGSIAMKVHVDSSSAIRYNEPW